MTHKNRGRLTVDLGGRWRLYTNTIPTDSKPLGTVTRSAGDTGALVLLNNTGIYVQINAGVMRSLDQRKVQSALMP